MSVSVPAGMFACGVCVFLKVAHLHIMQPKDIYEAIISSLEVVACFNVQCKMAI